METSAGKRRSKRLANRVFMFGLIILLQGSIGGTGASPAWSARLPDDLEEAILYRLENDETGGNLILQKARKAVESGIPPGVIAPVVEHCLDRGVDATSTGEILDEIISARERGLPAAPLASKVLEGLAKNAGSQGILIALGKVTERMETAAQIIAVSGPRFSTEEGYGRLLAESSDAIAAGLDRDQLTEIIGIMAEESDGNGKLEPGDVIELVKTLRGYGIEHEPVTELVRAVVRDKDIGPGNLRSFILNFVNTRKKGETGDLKNLLTDPSDSEGVDPAETGLETADEASEGRSSSGLETADEASEGRSSSGLDTADEASEGRSR